jgi:hypothetical protein
MKHGIVTSTFVASDPGTIRAGLAAGVVLRFGAHELRWRVEAEAEGSVVLAGPGSMRAYVALAPAPGGTRVALVHASIGAAHREACARAWRAVLNATAAAA